MSVGIVGVVRQAYAGARDGTVSATAIPAAASRSVRRISHGAHGATCSTLSKPLGTKRLIVVSLTLISLSVSVKRGYDSH